MGKHKVKASFAGDIVELFVNPSHDDQNNDNESNEESDDDGMDEQRQYDYDDNEEEEEENEDRMEKIEENKSSTHQRFESYQSNHSDPTPVPIKQKKNHSRGPSFAFKDLFRGDEDSDSSDRAPSVQSAPEEHDYYAITAYYGIEDDDDATGWDSRRSSMFGDYGKIHSRQQSKRVESQ